MEPSRPLDILRRFVRRWSIEVTFAEVRRHLGVDTQRQSSDPAIDRTAPILLGLFSLITLWANDHYLRHAPAVRAATGTGSRCQPSVTLLPPFGDSYGHRAFSTGRGESSILPKSPPLHSTY
jgi:hypothetical protein